MTRPKSATIKAEDVDRIFKARKKFYRKWNQSYCPPLGQIHINTHFWTHLKENKNRRLRPHRDVINRLRAIKQTKKLLESISHFQDEYEENDGSKKVKYWFIVGHTKHGRLGIVLRKVQQGKIHLYSIIPNWKGYIPREKLIMNEVSIEKK